MPTPTIWIQTDGGVIHSRPKMTELSELARLGLIMLIVWLGVLLWAVRQDRKARRK